MKSFQEMLRSISSSPHHDQMMRFVQPLNEHFGINHFWYYRITSSGDYCYLGSHMAWSEFCFDRSLVSSFPCLRHPSTQKSGISLMKSCLDHAYKEMLDAAWEKFGINFALNLQEKLSHGIQAFGFASRLDDAKADERLLNELPLLRQFIKAFCERNKNIFKILDDHQVNIASAFGSLFYERSQEVVLPGGREAFLRKVGLGWILTLTPREMDIMKYVASGYPAPYIAESLGISTRTVENYLASLKSKLLCDSKTDLIEKAKALQDYALIEEA